VREVEELPTPGLFDWSEPAPEPVLMPTWVTPGRPEINTTAFNGCWCDCEECETDDCAWCEDPTDTHEFKCLRCWHPFIEDDLDCPNCGLTWPHAGSDHAQIDLSKPACLHPGNRTVCCLPRDHAGQCLHQTPRQEPK